jgi:hypothetical protein
MVGCTTGIPKLSVDNLQGNEADQENQDEATGVPRVVFIELFNTDGCASSKVINPIMEAIVAEYENTEVILVEEAGWGIYSTEETSERFKWYFSDKSELHTPSVCFDGLNQLFAEGFSLGASGNSVNVVTGNIEDTEDNEDPEPGEVDTIKPDLVIEDTEEPVIEEPVETTGTVPQNWATGDGTESNPWANDCIKKAYDAVPVGGTIFLKAGYYELTTTVTISKQINLIGEGINKTIIITANAIGFQVDADYCIIRNLTVDGDAQTDANSGMVCINSTQANYLLLENIEIKNAGYYGLNMNDPNYCTFKNIYGHDNYRHGVHAGANIADSNQHNTYDTIYCWDNGVDGFNEKGGYDSSNSTYNNIDCWNNGQFGIAITGVCNSSLTNSSSYNNGYRGMYITGVYDFIIESCLVHSNYRSGIYLSGVGDNVNLSNVVSKNNSTSNTLNDAGLLLNDDPTTIKLSFCQFYDDRDLPLQDNGIRTTGTTKYVEITNCKLIPNEISSICNHAEAEIVIIEEIKLARL